MTELEQAKSIVKLNRKMSYNMTKYPFLKTKEDTELWLRNRKHLFPLRKALNDNEDIDKFVSLVSDFLKFEQTNSE